MPTRYQAVIGLEIHAQLLTPTKMFAPEAASYGALPNTQTTPITLAHPGTLPTVNKQAIDHAIRIGLATHCTISPQLTFARKQYFYPDLPKGYQISQDEGPLCHSGYLDIPTPEGNKRIRIRRIHLEEDTGKALHNFLPGKSLLDFNRAGTPLVEIVTEADIARGEEAHAFLAAIRRLVRYLDICDGNMEEGSLRCDANISIMPKESQAWGTRVEVKNMNSLRHVQHAIAYEIKRQERCLQQGERVYQETRSYQAATNTTHHLRYKESSSDYRYLPEPDLSPIQVDEGWIARVHATMPPLPQALHQKFTQAYGLSTYDADLLTDEKTIALFFEAICQHTTHYKLAANWVTGPVKSLLNKQKRSMECFPINAVSMARLVDLTAGPSLSFSLAAQRLLPLWLATPSCDPEALAREKGLLVHNDDEALSRWVQEAIHAYPGKVLAYRQGKKNLLALFMGEVMRRSAGKAPPQTARKALQKALEEPRNS